MKASEVLHKLKYKTGIKGLILNAPGDISNEFKDSGIETVPGNHQFPFLILFVHNSQEFLKFINRAIRFVECEGIFWIAYPKGKSSIKSDINRDKLWELMKPFVMRPVAQIAIDDTWSALWFKPEAAVKSKQ